MRGMPRPWICSIAQADVQLYAPYQENDRTEQRRAQRPQRQIPKSEFVWQAQEQVYVCPQGHRLTRISQETRERAEGRTVEVRTYRCPKEHCQQCPLARRCTSSAKGRTIKRNEHEDLIVAHQAKMQTPEAKGDLPQAGPDGGTAVRGCQGPPGSASVQWSGSGACADRGGTLCAGAQSLGCPGRRPAKSRRWTKWNVLPGRSLKAGRSHPKVGGQR